MGTKIYLLLVLDLLFSSGVNAQTVWNGPSITFSKAAFADPALPASQDRLTATTWLTRGNVQGLYNAVSEAGYQQFTSPANTEWATGTLANFASLTYVPWAQWAGGSPNIPNIVGKTAVVHLISENIYLSITFLSWGIGTPGGGAFSYQRTTAPIAAPVTLARFSVTKQNNSLALFWTTASEENTAFFSVERSGDGTQFAPIGTVPAAGNSTAERKYAFTDAAPLPVNFYRLLTYDKNGSVTYSTIVAFRLGRNAALQLFPNPVSGVLYLQRHTQEESHALITDAAGRVVRRVLLAEGGQVVSIETSQLQPGFYVLHTGGEKRAFIKR